LRGSLRTYCHLLFSLSQGSLRTYCLHPHQIIGDNKSCRKSFDVPKAVTPVREKKKESNTKKKDNENDNDNDIDRCL
jgi:hypothetical protein